MQYGGVAQLESEHHFSQRITASKIYGGVAQLGERMTGSHEVKSSNLSVSTKTRLFATVFFFFEVVQSAFSDFIQIGNLRTRAYIRIHLRVNCQGG